MREPLIEASARDSLSIDASRIVIVQQGFVNQYTTNEVHTAKYNCVTFLPKNLLEQFRRLANIYFLIIAVL
jgi:hypothetical protein